MPHTQLSTQQQNFILELALELVKRPSVTPDDHGCQEYVASILETLGFSIHEIPFGKVKNLWARIGEGSPHLLYMGHTDVVCAGDPEQWDYPAFSATIANGLMYGRGVCDMKGSVAAILAAASRCFKNPEHLKGSFSILLTSDEEGDATDGSVKALAHLHQQGQHFDYCLVGEPTCEEKLGDAYKIGRRGSLRGHCRIKGIQGHTAYPKKARNAVALAASMVSCLSQEKWDQGNEFFEPSNLEVYSIESETKVANVIPGVCSFSFGCRYNTLLSARQIEDRVRAIAAQMGIDLELEIKVTAKPFMSKKAHFSEIVEGAIFDECSLKARPSTKGGTSDARFAIDYCDEIVEFGLINQTIHQINERVLVKDLIKLSVIFEKILRRTIFHSIHHEAS